MLKWSYLNDIQCKKCQSDDNVIIIKSEKEQI